MPKNHFVYCLEYLNDLNELLIEYAQLPRMSQAYFDLLRDIRRKYLWHLTRWLKREAA